MEHGAYGCPQQQRRRFLCRPAQSGCGHHYQSSVLQNQQQGQGQMAAAHARPAGLGLPGAAAVLGLAGRQNKWTGDAAGRAPIQLVLPGCAGSWTSLERATLRSAMPGSLGTSATDADPPTQVTSRFPVHGPDRSATGDAHLMARTRAVSAADMKRTLWAFAYRAQVLASAESHRRTRPRSDTSCGACTGTQASWIVSSRRNGRVRDPMRPQFPGLLREVVAVGQRPAGACGRQAIRASACCRRWGRDHPEVWRALPRGPRWSPASARGSDMPEAQSAASVGWLVGLYPAAMDDMLARDQLQQARLGASAQSILALDGVRGWGICRSDAADAACPFARQEGRYSRRR